MSAAVVKKVQRSATDTETASHRPCPANRRPSVHSCPHPSRVVSFLHEGISKQPEKPCYGRSCFSVAHCYRARLPPYVADGCVPQKMQRSITGQQTKRTQQLLAAIWRATPAEACHTAEQAVSTCAYFVSAANGQKRSMLTCGHVTGCSNCISAH